MAYENILNAVKGSGDGLTTQQKADNYSTFSKMMENNVYLPDLVKDMEALKTRVQELEKPRTSEVDAEIFSVMEHAVKDDPDVVQAKNRLARAKTRIISELCMRDEEYRRLFDEYRTAVHTKYVGIREDKEGKR